jgi:hypothetical protein
MSNNFVNCIPVGRIDFGGVEKWKIENILYLNVSFTTKKKSCDINFRVLWHLDALGA